MIVILFFQPRNQDKVGHGGLAQGYAAGRGRNQGSADQLTGRLPLGEGDALGHCQDSWH